MYKDYQEMKIRLRPFVISMMAILLTGGWIMYGYGKVNLKSPDNFSNLFFLIFLAVCFLLFLIALRLTGQSEYLEKIPKDSLLPGWLFGFSLVLFACIGLALYVDPHARLGAMRYPPIVAGARIEKYKSFQGRQSPQIVILGSSRAFAIFPEYLREKFGVDAYNMSVDGGAASDFIAQLRYILSVNKPPEVLIIEVDSRSMGEIIFNPSMQPLALMPFFQFKDSFLILESIVQDMTGLDSLSDALFLLNLEDVHARKKTWTFYADGAGEQLNAVPLHIYYSALKRDIDYRLSLPPCVTVRDAGRKAFDELVFTARQHNMAIVFYISPMHRQLYDAMYKDDRTDFAFCRNLMNTYFISLASSNPNVFFQDLSGESAINDLDKEGFYDVLHLNPKASEKVIDALTPEIEAALQWARSERQEAQP